MKDNKKKGIIIGISAIAVIVLVVLICLLLNKNKGVDKNITTTTSEKTTEVIGEITTESSSTSAATTKSSKTTKEVSTEKTTTKEQTTTTTTTTSKKISYSCPSGYTLKDDKCTRTIRKKATASCPSGSYEISGKCVTISNAARVESIKECGENTFTIDNKGHTRTEKGVLITIPNAYSYCVYGLVDNTTRQQSQSSCTDGGVYTWANGKCYYSKTGPGQNMKSSCKSGLVYVEKPSSYGATIGGGCFPVVDYKVNCADSSYTGIIHPVDGPVCTKTESIDATKN